MKAVIVGAGGFLGRAMCNLLRARGHEVVAFSSANPDGINPETGTFRVRPSFPRGAKVVYYLAQSPFGRRSLGRADHLFAVGVVSALQAALAAQEAGIGRFIFASTGNVYQSSFAPRSEADPVRRGDWYALSKVHAEEVLGLLREKLELTCVRLFGLYGPGQTERLVPNLIRSVRDGREIILHPAAWEGADTRGLRLSVCHVSDAARIMTSLADVSGVERINVASTESHDIRGIAERIGVLLHRPAMFRVSEESRLSDLLADTSLLMRSLRPGFVQFDSALVEIVSAARDERAQGR